MMNVTLSKASINVNSYQRFYQNERIIMSHGHHHHHHHSMTGEKRLLLAITLTGTFMFVELVGGIMSSSLALLSDAVHMLTDLLSLVLAWFAAKMTRKRSDHKRSYGYHRMEVLAAFINGISLIVIVGWIVFEAINRMFEPAEVQGNMMLLIAFIGLLVNCFVFAILHRPNERNLNIKGAVIHVIGDLLSSVAAIIAAIVILYTGWMPIDPLLSLIVALMILRSAYIITKKSAHILMEGTPEPHLMKDLQKEIERDFPEIIDVHHIHIWSLTSDKPVVTLHVTVKDEVNHDQLLVDLKQKLTTSFDMPHSTIQIESEGSCPDSDDCHNHAS